MLNFMEAFHLDHIASLLYRISPCLLLVNWAEDLIGREPQKFKAPVHATRHTQASKDSVE